MFGEWYYFCLFGLMLGISVVFVFVKFIYEYFKSRNGYNFFVRFVYLVKRLLFSERFIGFWIIE